VQEYFLSARCLVFYRVEERLAHDTLAQICITALISDEFQRNEAGGFVDYAICDCNWLGHASHAGATPLLEPLLDALLTAKHFPQCVPADTAQALWHPFTSDYIRGYHLRPLTPLVAAVFGGFEGHVGKLLAKDHHASSLTKPFFTAVQLGYLDIARMLLEHGADVKARGSGSMLWLVSNPGFTPHSETFTRQNFSDLTKSARFDTLRMLLAHGAQPKTDPYALMGAAKVGDIKMLRLFLDHGALVNARNAFRETALSTASSSGHLEVVRFLLECGARPKGDPSALIQAAGQGHTEILRLLLDHGAVADACAWQHHLEEAVTALTYASWSFEGNIETIRLLLERGARPEADPNALIKAASTGNTEVLRLLLEHGAVVDAQDKHGITALSNALSVTDFEAVRFLLEHGARPEAAPDALRHAAEHGSVETVRLLLEHGAEDDVCDSNGRAALQIISIPQPGKIVPRPYESYPAIAQLLVDHRADIERRDLCGQTALQLASATGYLPLVRKLVDLGANVNAEPGRGGTALDIALRKGHNDVVELLVQQGAVGVLEMTVEIRRFEESG
jgi:ankyrin repeat protein